MIKNISDIYTVIYEEGEIISTPSNTMGMGNPCPAGINGNEGSEPLPDKKKKKCKKPVKEGILGNIDSTLNNEGQVLDFVSWLADNNEYVKSGRNDFINDMLKGTSMERDGYFVIEGKAAGLSGTMFDLFIPKTGIPNWIKSIKVINVRGIDLFSYVGDLSNLILEAYEDNGKSYSDISAHFKMSSAGKNIKFGKVVCSCLDLYHGTMENLSIDENSTIIELDLESCKKLSFLYCDLLNMPLAKISLPKTLVDRMLKANGVVSWSTDIRIV